MSPGLTWSPGQRLGNYTLLQELARGGMGEIWLARQVAAAGIERHVVIKRLITSGDEDPAAVQMFLDEARIITQLSHPNIVQVFDFAQEERSHYLVLEYLPGETLSRVMRASLTQNKPLDASLSAFVVMQAAAGLGHAHQKRSSDGQLMHVVHRDVSPQNVFVTYDGHVKVLDFGIAVAEGRITRTSTGTVKGKVSYMSPEHAAGQAVEPQADVFSLGVVLFEMLTRRRLYEGADDVAIFSRLRNPAPLVGPGNLGGVPGALAAITRRALAMNAVDRYADGAAFAEALAVSLGGAHQLPRHLSSLMHELFAERITAQRKFLAITTALQGGEADLPSPTSNPSMPGRQTQVLAPARARRWLLPVAVAAVLAVAAFAFALRARPAHVTLTVEPVTAELLVDGASCAAPCEVDLKPGSHIVEASAVGYQHQAQVMKVPSSAPMTVQVTLPRVESRPAEVRTELDAGGAEVVATKLLTAEDAGRPEKRVLMGQLTIDTAPWTKVYLGSRLLGETPVVKSPVPVGRVRLRLLNELEQIDRSVDVDIAPNGVTVKKLTL